MLVTNRGLAGGTAVAPEHAVPRRKRDRSGLTTTALLLATCATGRVAGSPDPERSLVGGLLSPWRHEPALARSR